MATAGDDRLHGDPTLLHETRHDGDDVHISTTIIQAVAHVEGVDPTGTDLRLYDSVDLEALDALFERRGTDTHWRFEFTVHDYTVIVDGDGYVTVFE